MNYIQTRLNRLAPEKKWLLARIEAIKKAPDGARRWLKDLGKNDFEHAEAVEEYIGKILSQSKVKLCPEEVYLIIHAIYLHDIGYQISPKDHAEHSYRLIIDNCESFYLYDENLCEAIALICLTHGVNDLNKIPSSFPIDFLSKTNEYDLRFLGSLLLMADEMDQGYLRVFNRSGQQRSPRRNVYHVEIGSQIVKLKTKPDTQNEWEELRNITKNIQIRLNKVRSILFEKGIKLEQVSLYPQTWSQQIVHRDLDVQDLGVSKGRVYKRNLFFMLDRSILGSDILQYVRRHLSEVQVAPISFSSISKIPSLSIPSYSGIILMLGEDFGLPLSKDILDSVIENTSKGAGLLLFPFAAWSVSQGLNDKIEELLPVTFLGNWHEGRNHLISRFSDHTLAKGISSFLIENTYEMLRAKPSAKRLISDSEGNPFLVIGSYKKGRVAYLNMSSHLCTAR